MRFLLSLVAALLLACLASAAPLPFAKTKPPAPEPAVYMCLWGGPSGSVFDVRLYPGGKYECRRLEKGPVGPLCYEGEWTQAGPTLSVSERVSGGSAGVTARWSVGPAGSFIDGKPGDVWLQRVR